MVSMQMPQMSNKRNNKVVFDAFSLLLPNDTRWAEFLDTDEHDPTYKIHIPCHGGELRITSDNFVGDWEEAKAFAIKQFKINRTFSPDVYNKDLTTFNIPKSQIEAFDYHYSSGTFPAQFVHIVFINDPGRVKRFVMTCPIQIADEADKVFIDIMHTYQAEIVQDKLGNENGEN